VVTNELIYFAFQAKCSVNFPTVSRTPIKGENNKRRYNISRRTTRKIAPYNNTIIELPLQLI